MYWDSPWQPTDVAYAAGSLVRPKVVKSVHFCPATGKTIERRYTDMTSLDAFPSGSVSGLDLSFAGSQGKYNCMWRCPCHGLNPSGLVNNSSLAAGPQFTELKIL